MKFLRISWLSASLVIATSIAVLAVSSSVLAAPPAPFDLRPDRPDGPITQAAPRDFPYALGCLPSSPLEYPPSLPPGPRLRAQDLPPSVDLTGQLPPVGDQGRQNSCVAWSTGYYYKSFHEGLEHSWDLNDLDHQFSPAFLYNQRLIKCQIDWGWYIGAAMEMLQNLGDIPISDFPYNQDDTCTQPTQQQLDAAQAYRSGSFGPFFINDRDDVGYYDNDLTPLKQELASGNVIVFASPVTDEFYHPVNCVIDVPEWPYSYGGHAIAVTGYDDVNQRFKFRNSWGTDWGCSGDAYLTYEFVRRYVYEAWWMQDRAAADFTVYLPFVQKSPAPGLYGRITLSGTSLSNAYVHILKYIRSNRTLYLQGKTRTDSAGNYRFSGLPSLTSGQEYWVEFLNERRTPGQLWRFTCKPITTYSAGTDKKACDFDVADVVLGFPGDGSEVDLPETFTWTRRPFSSDSYEFNLYDKWGDDWWWTDPPLGYVSQYTLQNLPAYFSLYTPYYWDLWIYTPAGTAWSLGANRVSFK